MDFAERRQKVEHLLHVKFPMSWAPPPISIASRGPVCDGKWHARLMQTIEAERAALMAQTDEELQAAFDTAQTVAESKAALKAEIEEKGRFFNWPSAAADYAYWAKADYWTLDESIALLLGKSPEVVNWKAIEPFRWVSAFAKRYADIRALASRADALSYGGAMLRPSAVLLSFP